MLLDFARQAQRGLQIPLRHDTGVHHQPALLEGGEAVLAQPLDPRVAVARVEDVLQGVAFAERAHAVRHREKMQVVVAEQAGRGRAQLAQTAQGGEVLRPAIHQVAEHDHVIARRREVDRSEQALERDTATLHVSDDVVHRPVWGGIRP